MSKDEIVKQGVRLYRDFLNMGEHIFDDYYVTEDNLPETTDDGVLRAYKSKELLTWMGDMKKWVEQATGQSLLKEDAYDQLKATNPSVKTLQETFGLEID